MFYFTMTFFPFLMYSPFFAGLPISFRPSSVYHSSVAGSSLFTLNSSLTEVAMPSMTMLSAGAGVGEAVGTRR